MTSTLNNKEQSKDFIANLEAWQLKETVSVNVLCIEVTDGQLMRLKYV
jgi:hypothetical protein